VRYVHCTPEGHAVHKDWIRSMPQSTSLLRAWKNSSLPVAQIRWHRTASSGPLPVSWDTLWSISIVRRLVAGAGSAGGPWPTGAAAGV